MKTYPYMQRAPHGVEVGYCRNGRPGYRWVPGWEVVYSPTLVGMVQTYRHAQHELKQAKGDKA